MERRPGSPYDMQIRWRPVLDEYAERSGRLWIIVPARRQQLNLTLQEWLGENASLVWRKYQTRYDYTFKGYEIFLVR